MSVLEGTVSQKLLGDGSRSEVKLAKSGELIIGEAHGRYFETGSRGNVFHASMQAGAALGTALTAAATTLTLYNPLGSGVVLSLLNASVGVTTAPVGQAVLIYAVNANPVAAPPSATTAAQVRCSLIGPAVGRGVAYTAATLPVAPSVARVLCTLTAAINGGMIVDDVNAAIILPENTAVTIQAIGVAVSGIVALSWEEIVR